MRVRTINSALLKCSIRNFRAVLFNGVHAINIFIFQYPSLRIRLRQLIYPRPTLLRRHLRQRWFTLINLGPVNPTRHLTPRLIRRWAVRAQPQRIYPPCRIRHVLVLIQPTGQLDRIRRQISPQPRVVIPVAVVMQAAFAVEVLPLKAQWLVQVVLAGQGQCGDFAVGVVLRGPDDVAAVVGEFLRGAEVVELVVERAGFFGPLPSSSARGRKVPGS